MGIKKIGREILKFLKNPFFKFFFSSILFVAWVQWLGQQWLLVGIIVLADLFLTKFVNWRFWRKRIPAGKKHKLSTEIIDSLIIAIILAVFIRVFFVEAYTIPTSSMEKTLLVDDYIFVSKLRYGPRLPLTPITIPFTHNTMPFTSNYKSFSTRIQFPYKRLKGYAPIRNYDVVVFNYPEGDTIIENLPDKNYYQVIRQFGTNYVKNNYNLLYRPVDKRDNYLKRAIGLPGDTIQIIHGRAFINNKAEPVVAGSQFNYSIKANGTQEDTLLLEKLGVSLYDVNYNVYNSIYNLPFTREMYHTLIDSNYFKAIVRYESIDPSSVNQSIFPFDEHYFWTEDNYGPLTIPKKGVTVKITTENLSLYKRIISVYEENELRIVNDSIYINNTLADSYTFNMDYFFMLGDNRHNSNDSRYWGFVPENHIIGKATFVWFSLDKSKTWLNQIKWQRMFERIK